jgi:hypothetical protein
VTRRDGSIYFFTPEQIDKQFTMPAVGEIGNSGRNAFRGPRFFNVDASLVKSFKLTEHHVVKFRAEAYNLFNHANFNLPGRSVATLQTLGKISSTLGSPRILQMALRYEF